jgi:hypothetical protein
MMLTLVGAVLLDLPGRQFAAMPLYLAGYASFIWGSVEYARAKGYSPYWGIFGVLWFIGFVPLLVLRDRHR